MARGCASDFRDFISTAGTRHCHCDGRCEPTIGERSENARRQPFEGVLYGYAPFVLSRNHRRDDPRIFQESRRIRRDDDGGRKYTGEDANLTLSDLQLCANWKGCKCLPFGASIDRDCFRYPVDCRKAIPKVAETLRIGNLLSPTNCHSWLTDKTSS